MATNQPAIPLPELIKHYQQTNAACAGFEGKKLTTLTFHSTTIEGGTLNWIETQQLLINGEQITVKPQHDQWMAIDHQQALQHILQFATDHQPINRSILQQITATLMKRTGGPINTLIGSFDSSKGEFRTISAIAGSKMFTDAKKVPAAVDSLLKEINTQLPYLKTIRQIYDFSFWIHYQFVTIHPFGDGNGRTARLLMNYVQHYHKLPLSFVDCNQKLAYYKALDQSRQTKQLKPIVEFMYSQLTAMLIAPQ